MGQKLAIVTASLLIGLATLWFWHEIEQVEDRAESDRVQRETRRDPVGGDPEDAHEESRAVDRRTSDDQSVASQSTSDLRDPSAAVDEAEKPRAEKRRDEVDSDAPGPPADAISDTPAGPEPRAFAESQRGVFGELTDQVAEVADALGLETSVIFFYHEMLLEFQPRFSKARATSSPRDPSEDLVKLREEFDRRVEEGLTVEQREAYQRLPPEVRFPPPESD